MKLILFAIVVALYSTKELVSSQMFGDYKPSRPMEPLSRRGAVDNEIISEPLQGFLHVPIESPIIPLSRRGVVDYDTLSEPLQRFVQPESSMMFPPRPPFLDQSMMYPPRPAFNDQSMMYPPWFHPMPRKSTQKEFKQAEYS